MLATTFNDFYFILPIIWSFSFVWYLFFIHNTATLNTLFSVKNKINLLKPKQYHIYNNIYIYVVLYIIIGYIVLFGKNSTYLFTHLIITNLNTKLVFLFTVLNLILGLSLSSFLQNKVKITHDYVFILLNITMLSLPDEELMERREKIREKINEKS